MAISTFNKAPNKTATQKLKSIKTGIFERRFSLYSTAIMVGTGLLSDSSINLVRSKESRKTTQKESLKKRSQKFADEVLFVLFVS